MSLFRRSSLRWKLVFSYVGVTLATVLALEAVLLLVMALLGEQIGNVWLSQSARSDARQLAQLAAGFLETGDAGQLT